ncbi:MAG: cytochrome c-type biogenesis CcmF C-terminal domain-containing protein [Solirubrobacteraceae bacterium]
MPSLGTGALLLGIVVCLYGIGASIYGVRTDQDRWIESGRRSVYALAVTMICAFAVLEVALLSNDWAFNTVADTSSVTTPLLYKAAAVWASQEGSLLLWALLSALWSSLALFLVKGRMREIAAYATAVLLAFDAFFIFLMLGYANPFKTTHPAPVEGAGLDPLLRFPTMMIHPPMIYSGYTLCIVPFAFGVGALITRKVDAEWLKVMRRFALAAWIFLGIGIVLGARWSYSELGWGGYWGWDAVENAALLPWLAATAFIHSLMIQEKRGMLKIWNASLVFAMGTLAIMGTFLVRSGILDSIHAFGGATLGVPFVILIGAMIAGSIYLVVSRRDVLRSEHQLDSLLSRESAFLLNNLVLAGLAFVIFWGTFFPIISEALTGREASVGSPWFDRYTVPLALVLVLLSGIGPVIAWRRATFANALRNLRAPILVALAVCVAVLGAGVSGKPLAVVMFAFAGFALAAVAQEYWRGTRVRARSTGQRPPRALLGLMRRNRRRYGGYIVHIGIASLFIGVAASSSFQHSVEPRLKVGQKIKIDGYTMRYVRPTASVTPKYDAAHTGATLSLGAVIRVTKGGKYITTLLPAEGFYDSGEPSQGSVGHLIGGQAVSHVALNSTPFRDLWAAVAPEITAPQLERILKAGNKAIPVNRPEEAMIVLALMGREYLKNTPVAEFHFEVSPMVMWIWIGAFIILCGGLIAIFPSPRVLARRVSVSVRKPAPVRGRERDQVPA